jgi:DNA-binding LacI/PurR family transcriptional regulator
MHVCQYGLLQKYKEVDAHVASTVMKRYPDALGYMIWTIGLEQFNVPQIAQRLVQTGKPVAVLDEHGSLEYPAALLRRRELRVFSMSCSPQCGENVGRYLLGLGHRRVAYVSPFHFTTWSRNRMRGLRSAFASAGLGDAVVELTIARESSFARTLGRLHVLYSSMHSLFTSSVRSAGTAFDRVMDHAGQFRRAYDELRGSGGPDSPLWSKLLEAVSADRSITAAVGANDSAALECIYYLRRRRKGLRKISVVGFDDTPEAWYQDLTSYNFNAPAVMHAMLAHITGSIWPWPGRRKGAPVEIDGFVCERGSCGPA